eukprot:6659138-Alexandrium_andersonii.AAC.1
MQFAARHSLHLHRLVPTPTAQFCVAVVRGVSAEGHAELVPGQEVYIVADKSYSLAQLVKCAVFDGPLGVEGVVDTCVRVDVPLVVTSSIDLFS